MKSLRTFQSGESDLNDPFAIIPDRITRIVDCRSRDRASHGDIRGWVNICFDQASFGCALGKQLAFSIQGGMFGI
jgi:hypothetical protein